METIEIKEALCGDFDDFIINAISTKKLSISELKDMIIVATDLLNIEIIE